MGSRREENQQSKVELLIDSRWPPPSWSASALHARLWLQGLVRSGSVVSAGRAAPSETPPRSPTGPRVLRASARQLIILSIVFFFFSEGERGSSWQ